MSIITTYLLHSSKLFFLYGCLLILVIVSCDANNDENMECINSSSIYVEDSIIYKDQVPFSGCIEKYDEEGELVLKLKSKDGILEGEFIEYRSGKVYQKGNYIDNVVRGKLITYYETGETLGISYADSNGFTHGEVKTYYRNQNIKKIQNYRHGFKEGVYKFYYKDGSLSDSIIYEKGEIIDTTFGYYKNGKLRSLYPYSKGKMNGISINFAGDSQNYFFWGKMKEGKQVGDWQYKLKNDSCFIKIFDEKGSYVDSTIDCSEIVPPPIKTEKYELK